MDPTQTRATIVTLLEQALKSAEAIDDGATVYLIERALDEARSRAMSSVAAADPLH
jgi:hypothetical protein